MKTTNVLRGTEKVATPGAPGATFFAVLAWLCTLVLLPAAAAAPAAAQVQQQGQNTVRIDSLAVEGNERLDDQTILARTLILPGRNVAIGDIQGAVKRLMSTGEFADVRVRALGGPGEPVTLVFEVEEHPLLRSVRVTGLENADGGAITDSTRLTANEPFSPGRLEETRRMIRSRLAEEGIPFARIEERVIPVEGMPNLVDLVLAVEEGNRVTIADLEVVGNESVSEDEIASALNTKPEGFWWFRSGRFDQERYMTDLRENLPAVYEARGFLDFQLLSDTVIIDPQTGKARIRLEVDEGPQYRIAQFTITGNDVLDEEELELYFREERGGLLRSLGIGGGQAREAEQLGRVFDRVAFEQALGEISQAYANRGYIFAQVQPSVEKREPDEAGGQHMVAVGVQIQEGSPAYVNRISIVGNDYTHEWVIRDKILMLPGDVYNQQRVLQSYQSIQSLGFFESPLPVPEINTNPETGEVDITFRVVEQQTGALNFGTSVGGGLGVAGFIGYDQPNLFGQAKEGHLRWDFGRYVNNMTVTFSDPALLRSRVSGTISLFNARDRFITFSSGRRRRIGGSLRFGFPIPGTNRTRFFAGYSLSRTRYDLFEGVEDTSLFGRADGTQSQISAALTRSTLNHPLFPTVGSRQNLSSEFNGGILGGDGDFQKVTGEGQWWVPVGTLGGDEMGGGMTFALGLSVRGGAVFGNADRFPFDRFWMGGVQFGQQLRGYDETSITPQGFFAERAGGIADIDRLGDAFLSMTAEYALRLNNNISVSTFFDAGNVWREPGDVDPTRLFRGAGFGVQLVTPFGPIGIDYAYGFDKPVPGWQLHFKMGGGF